MSIVIPNLPANLFIQPSSQSALPSDLRQLELRMDQVIRATVVDGGMERTFLEMNNQQFRAESERELQVGQQLRLQVTRLTPRLEFRVLQDTPKDRLIPLLPLLARSYDWSELVAKLQQSPEKTGSVQKIEPVLAQIGQLLGLSAKEGTQELQKQVYRVLELMARTPRHDGNQNLQGSRPLPSPVFGFNPIDFAEPVVSPADRVVSEIVQKLQLQLLVLKREATTQVIAPDWLAKTRALLQPLQKGGLLASTATLSQTSETLLKDVVSQLLVQPKVTPQLAIELERILVNLKEGPDRPLVQAGKTESITVQSRSDILKEGQDRPLVQTGRTESIVVQSRSDLSPEPSRPSSELSGRSTPLGDLKTELQQLVQLVRDQKTGLAPELTGRLEGLLSRLQQLTSAGQGELISQLMQLSSQTQQASPRLHLGLLSQLFGFYLETELLQGKEKAALATLKASLLNLQQELGEEVAEPLRRLELFQLCKARLAEDQVQFLPLPFPELEEGYLLADNLSEEEQQENQGINLSLSLRLSALGNLRIDMLYRPGQGLQMQVAGESQEKKRFLESSADEMREAVKRLDVQNIHFAADAKPPTKLLQERLMPDIGSVLDARI